MNPPPRHVVLSFLSKEKLFDSDISLPQPNLSTEDYIRGTAFNEIMKGILLLLTDFGSLIL